MSKYKTRELRKMGKRRFLKTLSSIGVSYSALANLDKESLQNLTDDPKREVPMLESLVHTNHEEIKRGEPPKREANFFTVPRDQWAEIKGADKASIKLEKQIQADESLPDLRVAVQTRSERSKTRKTLIPEVPSRLLEETDLTIDLIQSKLPNSLSVEVAEGEHREQVTDIPVIMEVVSGGQLTNYYDYEYRPVPGGVQLSQPGGDGDCTLATPAYDSPNGYVMVTAGHCAESGSMDVYQPNDPWYTDDNKIGQIDQVVGQNYTDSDVEKFDAATVDMNSSTTVTYKIAQDEQDSYLRRDIGGILSWDAITAWEGGSTEINYQGRTTGRSSGSVNKTYSSTKNFALIGGNGVEGGDSGGPMYRRQCATCDELLIAGVINGSNADGTVGTAMEAIENEFGIVV